MKIKFQNQNLKKLSCLRAVLRSESIRTVSDPSPYSDDDGEKQDRPQGTGVRDSGGSRGFGAEALHVRGRNTRKEEAWLCCGGWGCFRNC
ncbi:hypothetical protein V6Z11_D12G110900 [Gossypium hirsutum]